MEEEEVIITIKRDGDKPTLPDGKAHTVILFIFKICFQTKLVPTDAPQLRVRAGTHCHGDPG